MKVKFTHPVDKKEYEFTVALSVPHTVVTVYLENILDSLPVEYRFTVGKDIVNEVNKCMKNIAVESVVYSGNVFVAMAERVTYGAYSLGKEEDGVTYTLGNTNIVSKKVDVFSKKEGKFVQEARPAFVTYSDVVKFVKAYNKLAKAEGRTALLIDGNFTDEEMRKLRYFIKSANGTLSEAEVDTLKYRAEHDKSYEAFLMDKNSSDGKKARVQVFYDIFNRHTGKAVKAIQFVENDVLKECTTFNSMYKIDKNGNEVAYITALFNNWLNSELVTSVQHRAKAPETGKGKKGKGKNKPAPAPAEAEAEAEAPARTITEGSFADNWIKDKMQEVGCTREQAEAMWWAVYDMIE